MSRRSISGSGRIERVAQEDDRQGPQFFETFLRYANDANERGFWNDYMAAYEDMIRNTASKGAPWYVVPADNRWFTRVVVAAAVIDALAALDLKYPEVSKGKLKEPASAKRALLASK